jgi:hypothetical protein
MCFLGCFRTVFRIFIPIHPIDIIELNWVEMLLIINTWQKSSNIDLLKELEVVKMLHQSGISSSTAYLIV